MLTQSLLSSISSLERLMDVEIKMLNNFMLQEFKTQKFFSDDWRSDSVDSDFDMRECWVRAYLLNVIFLSISIQILSNKYFSLPISVSNEIYRYEVLYIQSDKSKRMSEYLDYVIYVYLLKIHYIYEFVMLS